MAKESGKRSQRSGKKRESSCLSCYYFIRHATHRGYRPDLFLGSSKDPPLSPRGKKEAKVLAGYLSSQKLDVVCSSPSARCLETALFIHKVTRVPLFVTPLLKDVDFGAFEGLTIEQVLQKYSVAMKHWMTRPDTFCFPRGESLKKVRFRVASLWAFCRTYEFCHVAIVSHHAVLKVGMIDLLKFPFRFFHRTTLLPGSLTKVEKRGHHCSLRMLNHTPSHPEMLPLVSA